ncbi:hypothetical protein KAR91_61735, partial [Candidatus Pacearchaeota archaeon]|nr:hypothetical protein [Candidatus Pacearchaeota archaeon]
MADQSATSTTDMASAVDSMEAAISSEDAPNDYIPAVGDVVEFNDRGRMCRGIAFQSREMSLMTDWRGDWRGDWLENFI